MMTLRSERMLKGLSAYDIAQLNTMKGCELHNGPGDLVLRLIMLLDEELRNPEFIYGLTPPEYTMCQEGKKIQAIKAVRERTRMGLADAKNFVEEAMDKIGLADLANVL